MDTKTEVKKPGRPPLPTDKVLSKCIEFRCTEAQYQSYLTIGAQEALRKFLDNVEVTGSPALSASPCGLPGSAAVIRRKNQHDQSD